MKKILPIVLMACSLATFSSCVQRTIYSQMSNPSNAHGGSSTKDQKPTSSKTLWFWQKEFWSPEM